MNPLYPEEWKALGIVFLVAAFLALMTFNPWNWQSAFMTEAEPLRPPASAKCWEPNRWSKREFCSEIYGEERHGYVNPGSMEWEVE